MAADFEAALISSIVDNRDIKSVIRHKIGPDFFYDSVNKAAFIFLMQWYNNPKYNDVPSWESFADAFQSFEPVRMEESLVALVDKVRQQKLYGDIASLIQEVGEVTAGDPIAGFEKLKKQVVSLAEMHTIDESSTLKSSLNDLRDEYLAMRDGDTKLKGYSYPWPALNDATLGLQREHLVFLYGRPKTAKAQPNSEPVLTPNGFVPMGSLRIGDFVIGSNGQPTRVSGVYPQGVKKVYTLTTSDGASTRCCDDHLWYTTTHLEARRGASGKVRTLNEIRHTLHAADGRNNHRLPVVAAVEYATATKPLPLHPYLLGALLGDGSMTRNDVTFCKPEEDVLQRVVSYLPGGDTYSVVSSPDRCSAIRIKRKKRSPLRVSTVATELDEMGLLGLKSVDKFIPSSYLQATVAERLQLLAGLLDTDGTIDSGAGATFCTSSPRLRDDFLVLARSLGATASLRERVEASYTYRGEQLRGADAYAVHVRFPDDYCPVFSTKHLAKWNHRPKTMHRTVSSVTLWGKEECTCIAVDAIDHLYVTKDFLVTHNTWLLLEIARNLHANGIRLLIFSQEISDIEIKRRFVALATNVNYTQFMRGMLSEENEIALFENMEALEQQDDFVVSQLQPGEACITDLQAQIDEYKPEVVLIDSVNYLSADWKELAVILRGMKRTCKAKKVPIVASTHANRSRNKGKADVHDEADDFAYGDAFYQVCDLALRCTSDIEDKKLKQVKLFTAAIREGQQTLFTVNTRLCEDLTQKGVESLSDEADDIDEQEAQDAMDKAADERGGD